MNIVENVSIPTLSLEKMILTNSLFLNVCIQFVQTFKLYNNKRNCINFIIREDLNLVLTPFITQLFNAYRQKKSRLPAQVTPLQTSDPFHVIQHKKFYSILPFHGFEAISFAGMVSIPIPITVERTTASEKKTKWKMNIN